MIALTTFLSIVAAYGIYLLSQDYKKRQEVNRHD